MVQRPPAAHPRSRGENVPGGTKSWYQTGSSPLTRGKHVGRQSVIVSVRLIPAHAGKTPGLPLQYSITVAHPRSRGENSISDFPAFHSVGSSPLTRGKRRPRGWPARPARLIPAHAGKTSMAVWKSSRETAHPRSRGENAGTSMEDMGAIGSSPLTRGKPVPALPTPPADGLIPAHAGKTRAGY